MRVSHRFSWIVPLCVLATAFLVTTPGGNPLPPDMYLDLDIPAGKALQIPGDCSTWHELYPVYCTPHHQDLFEDNGDGVISPCDYITLDGLRYHVQWVGPTYFLSGLGGEPPEVYEPTEPQTGQNPTCETWHEIYPEFSLQKHVDGWEDNGDGVLSPCDNVQIGGIWYHIDRIGLDIFVVPGPVGIEQGTWGKIKSFFKSVF